MRAGARLRADREDSETTCRHKKEKHSHTKYTSTQPNTHRLAHAHIHTAAVMRVYRDRHRDKTTFCILSCETPLEYSMTGSRDPGTVGVSCLCLTHIRFIILFCNSGRKFARAKDRSPLIISTLAQEWKQ